MIAALVCLGALVLAAGTCLGQGPVSGSPADVLPVNQTARIKAVDNMMENRRKTIAALLDVVKESQNADRSGPVAIWPSFGDGDRCWHAIRMLGELRAQEAVDPLLDIINIPFDTAGRVGDRKGWQRRMFPAVPALIAIGKPASEKALARIATDKSEVRRRFYVHVICEVEGSDLAKEMIRLAMEKEKDPAKKARLKAVLDVPKDSDKPIP